MDEIKTGNKSGEQGKENLGEKYVERHQEPEQIYFNLESAINNKEKVDIEFRDEGGELKKKRFAAPYLLKDNVAWIIAENGDSIQIDLSMIEKVELKNPVETPPEAEIQK